MKKASTSLMACRGFFCYNNGVEFMNGSFDWRWCL